MPAVGAHRALRREDPVELAQGRARVEAAVGAALVEQLGLGGGVLGRGQGAEFVSRAPVVRSATSPSSTGMTVVRSHKSRLSTSRFDGCSSNVRWMMVASGENSDPPRDWKALKLAPRTRTTSASRAMGT